MAEVEVKFFGIYEILYTSPTHYQVHFPMSFGSKKENNKAKDLLLKKVALNNLQSLISLYVRYLLVILTKEELFTLWFKVI